MKNVFFLLAILFPQLLSAGGQTIVDYQDYGSEIIATKFVDLLQKEDFSSAVRLFDGTMTQAMSGNTLQRTWDEIIKQAGSYREQLGTTKIRIQQNTVVLVTCQFENAILGIKVAVDSQGKIAGLYFVPVQRHFSYNAPDYARPDTFTEKEVNFGGEHFPLPGTLTVARGKKPSPAVILVHGSGPQDRDETIGPNKPFRDLAWGLASKGVTVLRYEKRTQHYAARLFDRMNDLTVEEETITDALAAVEFLRNTPEINNSRIYVLGHSLGGMLIPRIGLRDDRIAGLIILAGTSRPLEDVIYEQLEYIFNLDKQLTADEQAQLKQIHAQVQLVKSPSLAENTPSSLLPASVPAKYWLDLKNYHPAKEAKKLTKPILVLQGERDYQVTMDDYKIWRASLASHNNVRFKLFPTLNHLFMYGEGKSTPSEYENPGHVHRSVIEEIYNFVKL